MSGGGHPKTGCVCTHPRAPRRRQPTPYSRGDAQPPRDWRKKNGKGGAQGRPVPVRGSAGWLADRQNPDRGPADPGCPRGAFFAPDVWGLSIPTVRNAKRAAGCPGVAAGPPQRGPRDIFAGIRGGSQTPPLGTPRRIFCTARLGGLTPESYGAKYAPRGARCSRRHPIGVTSGQLGDGAGTDGSPAPIF